MNNEIITVNETTFIMLPQGELHEKEPYFKCECGQIIKKEKHLYKHSLTKSHQTNYKNRQTFSIPKKRLINPSF